MFAFLAIALFATSAHTAEIDPPPGFSRVSDMEGGKLTRAYSRRLGVGHELYLIVEMDLSERLIRDVCPPEAIECINAVLRPVWAAINAMKSNIANRPPWPFPDQMVKRVERRPGEMRFVPTAGCSSERWDLEVDLDGRRKVSRGVTVTCDFHKELDGGPWLTQASLYELRDRTVSAMPGDAFEEMAARALSSLRR